MFREHGSNFKIGLRSEVDYRDEEPAFESTLQWHTINLEYRKATARNKWQFNYGLEARLGRFLNDTPNVFDIQTRFIHLIGYYNLGYYISSRIFGSLDLNTRLTGFHNISDGQFYSASANFRYFVTPQVTYFFRASWQNNNRPNPWIDNIQDFSNLNISLSLRYDIL